MVRKKEMVRTGEIVYGAHPLIEILKAKKRKVIEFYTLKEEPKIWRQIAPLLPAYKAPVHHLTREQLTYKLGTSDHQGVGALVQPYAFRKKMFDKDKSPFVVVLDGVQDVRNFGAIIRSAYCIGVQGIVIGKKQGAPLTGAALKASAGLAERMEIYQAASTVQALQELQTAGYAVYVAALGGKKDVTQMSYKQPLCVVIGNEEKGVSSEVLKMGTVITLAQQAPDVSFNASVAAGIILFTIKQLLQ